MKAASIIFIFSTTFLLNCTEKKPGTKIIDNTLGFNMTVPGTFPKLDNSAKEGELKKGTRQLKKLHDSELEFDLSSIESASVFRHDDNNLFLLNIKNYNINNQGNYHEAINELNRFAYQTQALNCPIAKLDSVTFIEGVGGVVFLWFFFFILLY